LGIIARVRGDYERATRLFEESLELAREAGARPITAWALLGLANMWGDLGKRERAMQLYEEGLDLSKELGGSELFGSFLLSLGYEYLLEGDHERATALNEESAQLYRKRVTRENSRTPSTTWVGRRSCGGITNRQGPRTRKASSYARS
jgi:tetratricopeptide (TPR) repeat protein